MVEWLSEELVEAHLIEDHQQFWNSLKVGDDNLDSRSNSQNEPQQDLENLLKGNYALWCQEGICYGHSLEMSRSVIYLF